MKKFYYLVITIIVIQIFVYLTSAIKHPIEDYVGIVLGGVVIIIIGKLFHLLFQLLKKIFKRKK